MKLSMICERITLLEWAKTDFFDAYLLMASPYLHEPDNQALLTDRIDKLIEYLTGKLYFGLVSRAESSTHPAWEDDINEVWGGEGLRTWEDLGSVKDRSKQIQIIDWLIRQDEQDEFDDIYFDAWPAIVKMFYTFINPPNDPIKKFHLVDKFLGMAHNSGDIIDYMTTPWLFDAIYTRTLAEPNELARYASTDVVNATRSAIHGAGFTPVTDQQKRDLFHAKQQRTGGSSKPFYSGPHDSWINSDTGK